MSLRPTTATVTVTGPPEQIKTFLRLCATVDGLCAWGASRTLSLGVDGDGPGDLRFDFSAADMTGVGVPVDEIEQGKHELHMGVIGDNQP